MNRKIIPYEPYLKELARKLRNESTPGEKMLWIRLKSKRLGYDFHRQKPLLKFIVDFYCHELDLVIEIDGKYHHHIEQYELDVKREDELRMRGLNILRFDELQVKNNMANVMRVIESYILDFQGCEDTPLLK